MKARFLLLCVLLTAVGSAIPPMTEGGVLRDGDIIFHTSRSSQSVAIQRASGSKYSHMGIILFRNGKPYVLEAVQTVRYTPLQKWVARGEKGHYVAKRLVADVALMSVDAIKRLKEQSRTFEGKPYDLTFEWTDERIYCSELVWKIYERALGVRIGQLQKLGSFRLDDPAVRSKLHDRYGALIPLDEPVISPGAMFDLPDLVEVSRQ